MPKLFYALLSIIYTIAGCAGIDLLHFLLHCCGVKPNVAQSNIPQETSGPKAKRRYSYQKVKDARKHPIRGLWRRNGVFVARLRVEDDCGAKETKWVPLPGCMTVPQAVQELNKLKTDRKDNTLPILGQTPKFAEYVQKYLAHFESAKDAKRASTVERERCSLNLWIKHFGETRLKHINKAKIRAFVEKRQSEDGVSARTANLDVTILRNVLNRAIDDGLLKVLPTDNMRPLKTSPPTRNLVSLAEITKMAEAANKPVFIKSRLISEGEKGQPLKNAKQFSDYLLLLAYSGARRNEALRLRWSDVNFAQQQLTIGSDGLAKNHQARVIDFNAELAAHLQDMHSRRVPDSEWLFPSPQRGTKNVHAKTFVETMRLARKAANVTTFGFHDCRHFFISFCVMSQIDYMTIAKWVGHSDGGVLIGKVYGHLSNEHAKLQAQRINFAPAVVPAA